MPCCYIVTYFKANLYKHWEVLTIFTPYYNYSCDVKSRTGVFTTMSVVHFGFNYNLNIIAK